MTSHTQATVALNDGAAMPQFGLGVFQTPPDATEQIVRLAVDEGYRLVDTAAMYRNEDGVGKALLGRTDVFVTTKLGNSDHGFDEALRAFDASIGKLRRDRLDLYLIHWPRPRVNRYVESWKAFIRLQKEGRVRSIGVSNFNRDHLERIVARDGSHACRQSDRASPAVPAEGPAGVSRPERDQNGILEPARAGRFAQRGRNRRHRRQASEDPGASRHPLASRQRPDRDSENGAPRAAEGEHRRARLPARRRRHAAHRKA